MSDEEQPVSAGSEPAVEAQTSSEPATEQSGIAATYLQGEGSQTVDFPQNWKEILPEGVGDHTSLSSIKTVPDLAKAYMHTKSMLGSRVTSLPGEDSTPEQIQEFYEKLGVPSNPEDYQFAIPDNLPEVMGVDESKLNEFKAVAKSLNMTADQAKKLVEWQLTEEGKAIQEAEEMAEQKKQEDFKIAQAKLKDVWKDEFESSVVKVERVLNKIGLKDALTESGAIYNPDVMIAVKEHLVPLFNQDKTIEDLSTGEWGSKELRLQEIDDYFFSDEADSGSDKYRRMAEEKAQILKNMN